jgi:peptidoglycan/LPS O-acetylase OafA/YrhL
LLAVALDCPWLGWLLDGGGLSEPPPPPQFAKHVAYSAGYGALLKNPGALEYLVPSAAEVISILTMTQGMGVFDRLILNTPSWGISTEFYTYLLFAAVCLFVTGTTRLVAFVALSVIGFAVSVWASVQVHDCLEQGGCLTLTYDFGFLRTVFCFFLGALAHQASHVVSFNFSTLQQPGLLVLAILFSFADTVPAIAFALPSVFAILILSMRSDQGILVDIFKSKPMQILGERSYSIYLMHMPLLLIFENMARRVDGAVGSILLVLVFVATLVVVVLSGWTYKYIENPFRAKFNRYANRAGTLVETGDFLKVKERSNWLN